MILSVFCIVMSPGALVSKPDTFLDLVANSSREGANVVALISRADAKIVPPSKLRAEAKEFSQARMAEVLSQGEAIAASRAPWTGRYSSDGVSKLFTKKWRSDSGESIWTDNGVSAVLLIEFKRGQELADVLDANHLIDTRMGAVLRVPPVPADKVKSHLKASGTSFFAGPLYRGINTQSIDLPGGGVGDKVVGRLKWHNVFYVATDGTRLLLRLNFYDVERELAKDIADPQTRFLSN